MPSHSSPADHRDPSAIAVSHDTPPLIKAGFPVAVCWSAKAGCTTMLKWFLRHTGLFETAFAFSGWLHHYRVAIFQHPLEPYLADCAAALASGTAEVVKVVRDPAARAVSSYLHLLRFEDPLRWDPGVSAWKQRVGLDRQAGLSFEQFLEFVIDARTTGHPLDLHFAPQSVPGCDRVVDRVISLAGLAAGLADLEDRHGLPRIDIAPFRVSTHHNPVNLDHRWPRDAAGFAATAADLETLGTPPGEIFLNARTRGLVRAAYDVDYEAYGGLFATSFPTALRRAA